MYEIVLRAVNCWQGNMLQLNGVGYIPDLRQFFV